MFVYRSSKQFQSNTGMYRVKRVAVLGQTGSVDSVHRSESRFVPVVKVGYHPMMIVGPCPLVIVSGHGILVLNCWFHYVA